MRPSEALGQSEGLPHGHTGDWTAARFGTCWSSAAGLGMQRLWGTRLEVAGAPEPCGRGGELTAMVRGHRLGS